VKSNETVVVGHVLDTYSYWNAGGTFILTDVRVAVDDVLKGVQARDEVLTLTLMGGSVGDLTTLIVGGADLKPGGEYVLFVGREELPGGFRRPTVSGHSQGVFEVVYVDGQARAVSQAVGHALWPDGAGHIEPPGGPEGLALEPLIESVRQLARSDAARRVK
jgi:hypothetical protein